MGKHRASTSRFFKSAALALLLASCTTAREIQGPTLFEEIEPLDNTKYYQGGTTSLPAARQFTQIRAQAFLDAANRESSVRGAATATTLGTALAALGLSLNGAGSPELFSILGLGNMAAQGGSQLYTNRLRQMLLDEGGRTLNCLVSATDPYFTQPARVQKLFGRADINAARHQLIAVLSNNNVSAADIARITANMPDNTGLHGKMRGAMVEVQTARFKTRVQRDLLTDDKDKPLRAELEAALSEANDAVTKAEISAGKLATYRAGIDIAGAALSSRTRDVILIISKKIRRLEPDPAAAAATFANIKSGLGATLEGFNAGDIRTALGGVAKTTADKKLSGGKAGEDARAARDELLTKLAELHDIVGRVADELIIIEAQKKVSGSIGACKDPTTADTVLVAPPGATQTLAAGETTKLIVTVGGGATPAATDINDPKNALKITGPVAMTGTAGRFEFTLTAEKDVAENTNVEVLITSDKSSRAVRKIITVTAAKKPTLAMAPTANFGVKVGKKKTLAINVSDGTKPTATHKTATDVKFVTIGDVTKKTGSDKDFNVELTGVKAKSAVKLEIKAGAASEEYSVNVTGPAPVTTTVLPTAKGPEKVEALVRFIQTYLNDHYKSADQAPLPVNGKFTAETGARLKKLQEASANGIATKDGHINDETLAFFCDKMIAQNQAKIDAAWLANKEAAMRALKILKDGHPAWAGSIQVDDNFDANERTVVWLYQYGLHLNKNAAAGAVKMTGALDAATINHILKGG